jgi:hypothetical protein
VATTPLYAFRYPGVNDAPNGAGQIGDLASDVESRLSTWTKFARKTGDTSRNTTTTFANDPDLTVAVTASSVYVVTCNLAYHSSSQSAGDFKMQFTAPAGAALQASVHTFGNTGTAASDDLATSITLTTTASCGVVLTGDPFNPCLVVGLLVVAGTAGNFVVQWAQNTSSGTNTTLKANSFLHLQRVA